MSTHNIPFPGQPAGMIDDGDGGLIPDPNAAVTHYSDADEFAGIVDYFGVQGFETFRFPDGVQYIEFKRLNEGDRVLYEQATQQDVKFNRRNDDAAIKIDAASSRHQLILISVTGWKMMRTLRGQKQWVPFSSRATGRGPGTLEEWLKTTDPKVVNDVYQAIRNANPFLVEEETVEIIDEEIASLQTRRAEALKREAQGKLS